LSLKVIRSNNIATPITPDQPTILRILQWNKKRNNLEFNIELESAMLSEEANEFFQADTLVDRLDAYADFVFVGVGSVYKHLATKHKYFVGIEQDYDQMNILTEWMNTVREQMIELITNEILMINPKCTYKDEDIIETILNSSLDIVIDANEKKGTERDSNGKVIKGADYIKPEKTINKMLCEKLGDSYVKLKYSFE